MHEIFHCFQTVKSDNVSHREAVLHDDPPTRWLLEEFALAHTHSKNRTGKYLVTLMLDDIKAGEISDANLKNHLETKTYLKCKDLVSKMCCVSVSSLLVVM